MKAIPQRATKKELKNWYNCSHKTLKTWLSLIPNLEAPQFGKNGYSRQQLKQIFDHLTAPDKFQEL